jgi:hypothetical protein
MIFLDEKMSPMGGHSEASAYLNEQTKAFGLKESQFKRFAHDAGGMEICFEAECAWNQLTNEMAVAEFKSLQESQCLNEGFWDTIKSWASKVKAFFIKIWNAIKAWIKNMWQKLTGTTDKDLIKKVQEYASYGEKVDAELYYSPNEFEKQANAAVDGAQKYIDHAYGLAQKIMAINLGPGITPADKAREMAKEAEEKGVDRINSIYENFADKDTDSIELTSNDIVAGLSNYEKQVKKLVQFLEKEDKVVKTGMKAAEEAEKKAKKNETDVRKKASDPKSGVKTDPHVTTAQFGVDMAVKTSNICRKIIQTAMKVANGVKARLDHDHEACRSAAKAFVKSGIKNKKSND